MSVPGGFRTEPSIRSREQGETGRTLQRLEVTVDSCRINVVQCFQLPRTNWWPGAGQPSFGGPMLAIPATLPECSMRSSERVKSRGRRPWVA
jgi:hypothetical protein